MFWAADEMCGMNHKETQSYYENGRSSGSGTGIKPVLFC